MWYLTEVGENIRVSKIISIDFKRVFGGKAVKTSNLEPHLPVTSPVSRFWQTFSTPVAELSQLEATQAPEGAECPTTQ